MSNNSTRHNIIKMGWLWSLMMCLLLLLVGELVDATSSTVDGRQNIPHPQSRTAFGLVLSRRSSRDGTNNNNYLTARDVAARSDDIDSESDALLRSAFLRRSVLPDGSSRSHDDDHDIYQVHSAKLTTLVQIKITPLDGSSHSSMTTGTSPEALVDSGRHRTAFGIALRDVQVT